MNNEVNALIEALKSNGIESYVIKSIVRDYILQRAMVKANLWIERHLTRYLESNNV